MPTGFIEYRGKKILYEDYSNATTENFEGMLKEASELTLGDGDRWANHDLLRLPRRRQLHHGLQPPVHRATRIGDAGYAWAVRTMAPSSIPAKTTRGTASNRLFTYKLNNPKWAVGLRYEWVQDNQGSRVAGRGQRAGEPPAR